MDGISVHHNLCNGMESSKHSMVKSPYFFSTFIVDARGIVSQAYPNKLLDNNDGHQ